VTQQRDPIYGSLKHAAYDCRKSTRAGGDAAMLVFGILGGALATLFFGALFTGERA
jgi:hypothetical protein